MDSQQGADAFAVLVVELEAIGTFDLIVDAGLLHFEAGGIYNDVQLVLLTFERYSLLIDLGDALALGINQVDVRPVESRQVVVVEAWAVTHEHVPSLKRLSGSLVLDDRIDGL